MIAVSIILFAIGAMFIAYCLKTFFEYKLISDQMKREKVKDETH